MNDDASEERRSRDFSFHLEERRGGGGERKERRMKRNKEVLTVE